MTPNLCQTYAVTALRVAYRRDSEIHEVAHPKAHLHSTSERHGYGRDAALILSDEHFVVINITYITFIAMINSHGRLRVALIDVACERSADPDRQLSRIFFSSSLNYRIRSSCVDYYENECIKATSIRAVHPDYATRYLLDWLYLCVTYNAMYARRRSKLYENTA
jgi:hypothetical protein